MKYKTNHLGRRACALCLTVMLGVGLLPFNSFAAASGAQGDGAASAVQGSKDNPYLIASAQDMEQLRAHPDAYFVLTRDVDMLGVKFTPVQEPFTGTLDGKGYAITTLTIGDKAAALFYKIANEGSNATGVVKNIVFKNATVAGTDAAAVVACINEGYISNIKVDDDSEITCFGTKDTVGRAGALAAQLAGGTVQKCVSAASVSGTEAGGLVGLVESGATLRNCFAGGSVTGGKNSDSVTGPVFGNTTLADITASNVFYCVDDIAKATPGMQTKTNKETAEKSTAAYVGDGFIGVRSGMPVELKTGNKDDKLVTFTEQPAKGTVISYQSDKPEVLSVDKAGVATALKAGSTQYSVDFKCGDGNYTTYSIRGQVKVTGDASSSDAAASSSDATASSSNTAASSSDTAASSSDTAASSSSTAASSSSTAASSSSTAASSSSTTASSSNTAASSSDTAASSSSTAASSSNTTASSSNSAASSAGSDSGAVNSGSGSTSTSGSASTPPADPDMVVRGTWHSENGKRYYLQPDGTKATGRQMIDDLYYVFDETGTMLRYEFLYKGCWYLTDENGVLYRDCFLTRRGQRTFYDKDGAATTGWIDAPDGKQYYQRVNEGGGYVLATGVVAVDNGNGGKSSYLFDEKGVRNTGSGWVGGVHLNEGIVSTGRQTFDGKTYIIKEDGTPNTGEFTYGGTTYFADEGGVVLMDAFRTMPDGTLRYYNADGQAKAGWVRRSDGDYYQSAQLVLLTGRQGIDGKTYFFGSDGKLSTTDGWAGDYYVKGGTALTGMQQIEGKTYYLGTDGLRVRGTFTLDDAKYSSDENGVLYKNAVAYEADGAGAYYGADGKAAAEGWVELNGVKYYQLKTLVLATGKQAIGGEIYYFMTDGKQQTGDGWADVYYLKNGRIVTGPQTIDGAKYIFSTDGMVYKGEFTYRNDSYSADETGKLYTDTVRPVSGGKLRYYGADGKAPTKWIDAADGSRYYQFSTLVLATGNAVIDGKTYYFDEMGRMVREGWVGSHYIKNGLPVTGPQTIDGKKYIFSDLGVAYKYVFTYEKLRYYASGTGVLYTNCFLTTGGKTTYYDETGAAHTGWITSPNGAKYYQTTDYDLLKGQQTIDKVVYFFGTDGKLSTTDGWAGDYYVKGGAALTGMQTIDGADYFFGADGILQRGEIVWQNDTYFADAKGVVQRDMVRTLDDGTLRYYGADGKAVTAGWFKRGTDEYYQGKDMILAVGKRAIDGKLCFFGTDGKRKTTDGWAGDYYVKDGVALTGFQDALDGGTYVFNDEGVVFKGDFTWDGASYYGDPTTGAMLRSGIHAVADGSGNRYHDKDGKAVAGVWIDLDGARYYQTDALLLATGRQSIEDEIYYFETSGKLKTGTGWADSYYLVNGKVLTGGPHELEGKLYVFNDDGLVQKDNFEAKGLWYCADETGALYTDTIRTLPDGRLRYLDKTGAAKPGFIDYTDGSTYYQGTDGCLVTGLQTIDGKTYYFGEDGKKKADGWVDGYYLKDGKPVTGQQVIDNKTYIFDDSGHVKTGEFTYNGAAYAADEAGALYLDAVFTRKDGAKAYYGADGTAPAGWAESPTGAKYYQSVTNGVYTLAVGLAPVGNETYYFLSSGKLFSAPAGWYIVNGKQCYLLADGRYCTPPAIEAVKTVYDAEKKLYSITIESTISTAAGTNAGGSFSFDGGLTWQASNVKTVPSDKGIMLSAGKIRVRDGVGQIVQYAKTIYLAPVVVIPGGSGNSGPGSYGIDVSQYNGAINWPAVKASGIQFALIRATSCNSSGYYVDPYFESNVRSAKAAGIDVGLYIFSYATSYGDVNDEINFFKNSQQVKNLQASGITLDYPVYIDYEANKNLNGTTYDQRTDYVRQAMVQLRNAGFYPGFYTYHSYCNYFNVAQLVNEGYDFWYARYPLAPNPPSNPSGSIGANVSIWQYCSDGNTNPAMQPRVNGVYTSLDLNYVYDDVPSRVHKFYGTGSSTTPPTAPDGIVTQNMLTVYDTGSGRIVTDTATNILAKIVQTEVGGFNNPEVYKAQAVAAYSYIMYQAQSGATPNVSLSSPSSAVTNAVNAVANKIVTYNGTVANTMYGAANSGKTQSTEAMWGGAYPYLVAGIDSPGDLSATVYANGGHTWQNYSNTISLARMTSNIEKMLPGTTSGRSDYENWIVNPEYDGNGYLTYITVMGTRIRAGKFYDNCWGLYSPNFNVSYNGNGTWTFVTRGNGHGVGMSQWGAWGFAKQGWNYEQILNYYYPGTAVSNMG